MASIETPGSPAISPDGNRLYANDERFISIIDITNPAGPRLLATYNSLPEGTSDIAVSSDGAVLTASRSDGLLVLPINRIE